MVGRRRVRTIEACGWRVSARRAVFDPYRWVICRDRPRAFAVYLPFVVVTAFSRRGQP